MSFSFHQHPAASLSVERGAVAPSPPGVSIGIQTTQGPPINVRGELTALFGKLRFKLLTGPDLPFVSKLMVAFTTPPVVETAVMPLSSQLNIMHVSHLTTHTLIIVALNQPSRSPRSKCSSVKVSVWAWQILLTPKA